MQIETARTILGYVKQHEDLSGARLRASRYDWMYMTTEQCIVIAVEYTEEEKEFNKWLVQYLNKTYDCNFKYEHMEIFSLLHEVGHHVMGSICTDEEYYMLYSQIGPNDNYEYRQIPDEKLADSFAVGFMEEHLGNILELLEV